MVTGVTSVRLLPHAKPSDSNTDMCVLFDGVACDDAGLMRRSCSGVGVAVDATVDNICGDVHGLLGIEDGDAALTRKIPLVSKNLCSIGGMFKCAVVESADIAEEMHCEIHSILSSSGFSAIYSAIRASLSMTGELMLRAVE